MPGPSSTTGQRQQEPQKKGASKGADKKGDKQGKKKAKKKSSKDSVGGKCHRYKATNSSSNPIRSLSLLWPNSHLAKVNPTLYHNLPGLPHSLAILF